MTIRITLFSICIALLFALLPGAHRQTDDDMLLVPGTGVDNLDFLSDLEKNIIVELNTARTNPAQYAEYIEEFKKHYAGLYIYVAGRTQIKTAEGVSAVDEAIEFLQKQSPISALHVSNGLSLASREHVKTQGPTGLKGHEGPDGSTPEQRISRFGTWGIAYGENVEYGNFEARQIIMQLIIDDGVPNRSHRNNIFNPVFTRVGVSFGSHNSYTYMCVMDFAGTYDEND